MKLKYDIKVVICCKNNLINLTGRLREIRIESVITLHMMRLCPSRVLLLRRTVLASNDWKYESDLNFFFLVFVHTGCRWRSSIIVSSHRCGTRRRILCLWNEEKTDWCSPFDSDGTRHRFLTRTNAWWFDRYNYMLTISKLTPRYGDSVIWSKIQTILPRIANCKIKYCRYQEEILSLNVNRLSRVL